MVYIIQVCKTACEQAVLQTCIVLLQEILYCILWYKTSSNTKRHSWNKIFLFITGRVRPASRRVLHAIYLDRTSST